MRFSLLGPLVVADGLDRQVVLGGPRLRVLLAALLLRADILVPASELAEAVWDGSPPSGAVSTLRSYVRRLRQALGNPAARIVAHGPGYLIHAERQELDVLQFEAWCGDARAALRAGEWTGASASAARALGLWRAAPLLDVPSETLRQDFVPRLEQLRLQVLEDRFDAGLRLGQHQELIPQLLDMAAGYPLQERFRAQLMLALAATGRQAEALSAYQDARRLLVDELGTEPGPELRDIHQRILTGDVTGMTRRAGATPTAADVSAGFPRASAGEDAVPALTVPSAPTLASPAQLPADIADFTGRVAQDSCLHDVLTGPDGVGGRGTVPVIVIAGAAGLGKSTLAVHAAHRVLDLFPDGQLFVQLAGASGHPAVPGEVLARLLRDLGMDDDKIPAAEEERAALYRTQLAGRRVLVVLDDARDAAQVRPLLPGSASCTVLVTSRNKIPHLLSTTYVDLGTFTDPEALELFSRIVRDGRPPAEPDAAAEIVRSCAGLPLAIRICAARLATRPQWPLATMAARLRDERQRLDELRAGDLEVRASFQVSYDSLGGERTGPARAFRLLGLFQGQRISLPAVAALAGEPEADIAGALEMLVDVHLAGSPEPDWYQLHDLLRLFAAEQAHAEDAQEEQAAAVTRLLRWYLTTATAAADLLSPFRYRLPGEEPPSPRPAIGSANDALDWFDREQANLIPVIRQAAAAGLHDAAWRLLTTLDVFFIRRSALADCIPAQRIAVTSARLAGSRPGEAWALYNLGYVLAELGDAEAFGCIQRAADIRREMGDPSGEARTLLALTEAHLRVHGPQAAYDHSLRSVELLRRAEDPVLLSVGLNNHGDICMQLGKTSEATRYLEEALDIMTAIGIGNGHGEVLENLSRIHLESGHVPEALANLSEAYRFYLQEGHLRGQARALKHLGEAQHRAGQADQARESLEAALTLFEDLQAATEVEHTQAMLAALAEPATPA
jgi:DNA-binding SARP family transcriptional activator/tetratricopeptide (TPR) repeat protein